MIHPHPDTNVKELLCGRDVLATVNDLVSDFIVTTMPVPWTIAQAQLKREPRAVLMADSMDEAVLDQQVASVPDVSTVVAIGGGRAIDLGKYVAWKKGLRLISVPTALSVDAFVTPAAGIRREGQVHYVGEASPDPLVIDYEVLRTAPPEMNIAGVGDLLSIHTATYDWELAAAAGRSEYPFSEQAVREAREILSAVWQLGPAIRANSDEGLQAIVDGYMKVNQICLPAGHYRVEEGSEHYLFYELEERLRRPFVHGPIVGLGVAVLSQWQENQPERVCAFMDEVGLAYQPFAMEIDRDTLRASIANLREYVRPRSDLWYTVIDERPVTPEWIEGVLDRLEFAQT